MLYGIEATSFKQSDIDKMEKFQRKILRQLQFLPSSPAPANAAVYGLLGAKPVEPLIDTAILILFGSIIRNHLVTPRVLRRKLQLDSLQLSPSRVILDS